MCTNAHTHTLHCVHHCQNKWNVGSIITYMLSKLLCAHSVVMMCRVCVLLAALLCWSREISPSKATAIKITCVCFNLCNWLTGRVHVCVLQVDTAVAKFSREQLYTNTSYRSTQEEYFCIFFEMFRKGLFFMSYQIFHVWNKPPLSWLWSSACLSGFCSLAKTSPIIYGQFFSKFNIITLTWRMTEDFQII